MKSDYVKAMLTQHCVNLGLHNPKHYANFLVNIYISLGLHGPYTHPSFSLNTVKEILFFFAMMIHGNQYACQYL